ncbi:MAG: delta-60 repeat domain-containing protein [Flavobacteriales bacterium]|nr:delta-60 repeat domain-containing protein [Flavobacteriales bacterium]
MLVGGWFTSYDGIGRNRIARLRVVLLESTK